MEKDEACTSITVPTFVSSSSTKAPAARKSWAIRWLFPDSQALPTAIDQQPVCIGRSRKCDFCLDSLEVSARHAQLEPAGSVGGIQIRDLASTNGVYINGQRLAPDESRRLSRNDVVRLGGFVGVVDLIAANETDIPTRIEQRDITIQYEVESDRGVRRTERQTLGLVVGPSTRPVINQIEKAAPTDCNVILVGETGTGKEYVAKALHAWSKRSGQYIGLNCWDLKGDPGLARAKLFGVEPGAFAGAIPIKGAFRDADGGTLLLDEVMELPIEVQPMLLRVLQEKLVHPVGGKRPVSIDVRLVVASKRPLDQQVEAGTFSLDLYQRLYGLSVELMPLRERRVDIPFLFLSSLRDASQAADANTPIRSSEIAPSLIERLCLHHWPGNLRELVTLAGNFRRLWDHAGQRGYRFRAEDLPYQIGNSTERATGKDRERKDAAELHALITAMRAELQARGAELSTIRRQDLNFEAICEKVGVQRSLGYRHFKKWSAFAEKGLIELPRDEFEQYLFRRYAVG